MNEDDKVLLSVEFIFIECILQKKVRLFYLFFTQTFSGTLAETKLFLRKM